MSDPFLHTDAVYVLGALDETERAAYEQHLETCPECQARVAEARPAAALLGGLTLADLDDPGPVPDMLLPGLLRAARRERSRRRGIIVALGAVAAACVTALVVVLWPGSSASQPAPLAFAAVTRSPVTATAQLVDRAWGTEIELHCRYADTVDEYTPYDLVVVDKQNREYPAGSWTLAPGHPIDFTGGTALHQSDIDRIEITLVNGAPILQLKV